MTPDELMAEAQERIHRPVVKQEKTAGPRYTIGKGGVIIPQCSRCKGEGRGLYYGRWETGEWQGIPVAQVTVPPVEHGVYDVEDTGTDADGNLTVRLRRVTGAGPGGTSLETSVQKRQIQVPVTTTGYLCGPCTGAVTGWIGKDDPRRAR